MAPTASPVYQGGQSVTGLPTSYTRPAHNLDIGSLFRPNPIAQALFNYAFNESDTNQYAKDGNQNEKKPKNCPSGTKPIDKVKNKYDWDKDKLQGIKDGAHGGIGNGKSWTGVAPDGTVGINEGGHWSPQGYWTDLL